MPPPAIRIDVCGRSGNSGAWHVIMQIRCLLYEHTKDQSLHGRSNVSAQLIQHITNLALTSIILPPSLLICLYRLSAIVSASSKEFPDMHIDSSRSLMALIEVMYCFVTQILPYLISYISSLAH